MATARRSEAIWIEAKNYWEVKVQRDGTRKSFRSSQKGRKGKHEAEYKADKWLATGTIQMRFSEAWNAYLESLKAGTGTGNYNNNEQYGRLHLMPHLKNKKLGSITRMDWQRCINEMKNKDGDPLSERTCKNVISSINAFISYCDGERWEVEPIKKKLTVPSSAEPTKEKKILQPPDLKVLFSDDSMPFRGQLKPAFYIHAWRFYVVTGLRRGELVGLRNEDVGTVLSVKRNVNKLLEETHGKNENARRQMKIGAIAATILEDQRKMLEDMGIYSDWVFPDKDGSRSDPNKIYKHWVRYGEHHGIKCTIHELRHTFISINKIDMPIELLKTLVGHSVSMDTVKIYGHEVDGEQERAAKYVDDIFGKLLGEGS